MITPQFINFPLNGYLGCFYFGAIINININSINSFEFKD